MSRTLQACNQKTVTVVQEVLHAVMGYEVYSKASNCQISQALRRRASATSPWARVGKNAIILGWEGVGILADMNGFASGCTTATFVCVG